MSIFKIQKVIGSLPESVDPDCLYLVRTGPGFDLYASDVTGAIAHPMNGGTGSGGSINDLLSIPLARIDHFEYAIVIQDGEVKRMPYSTFVTVIDPAFVPPEPSQYGLVYDSDYLFYDENVLVYTEEILSYGDEFLYYGEEPLEYFSTVPDAAVYHDGEPIYHDGEVVTHGV